MGILIDIVLCLLAVLFFFLGYRKGFLRKAWWLVDLVVIVLLFAMLSPSILQWIEGNTGWKTALVNWLSKLAEKVDKINPEAISDFILKAGICLVLGIIVIIVMLVIKLLLKKLIGLKFFEIVDKIMGGIYNIAVVTLILMVIGGVVGTFVNYAPIQKASEFFADTYMAKYIFGENLLQGFFDKYFPLGTWIADLLKK